MFIPKLDYVVLFVKDPIESAKFYSKLFEFQPIEESPTFVLFALKNGIMLGLWSRYTAKPAVTAEPGSSEICFSQDNVDQIYDQWVALGVKMAEAPTDMEGGRSFLVLDPDGHRIRIIKIS